MNTMFTKMRFTILFVWCSILLRFFTFARFADEFYFFIDNARETR